jgi:hypothetical protein
MNDTSGVTPTIVPSWSRIDLCRLATNDLPPDDAARLRAAIADDPAAAAFLDGLERARAAAPPFDAAAIRGRVAPKRRSTWAPLLMLAAAAALTAGLSSALVGAADPMTDAPSIRARGATPGLTLSRAVDGRLVPWDGAPLGEGDVLGATVFTPEAAGVVLMSIDGDGAVSVYFGASGDPEPITAGEPVHLPGTIVLDGAPGPEVFVAVFDVPADPVHRGIKAAWREGGAPAVVRWAERVGASSVVVERR